MFKRYILASLVAGLALGAQSAVAGGTLWFYEGHGWLPQPPFGITASNPQTGATRPAVIIMPAPYNTPGGYFN